MLITSNSSLVLHEGYPNPFNRSTVIRYRLPETGNVLLEVYDLLGRRVRVLVDGMECEGTHEVLWNGLDDGGHTVSSGMYFILLKTGTERLRRKVLLVE